MLSFLFLILILIFFYFVASCLMCVFRGWVRLPEYMFCGSLAVLFCVLGCPLTLILITIYNVSIAKKVEKYLVKHLQFVSALKEMKIRGI